MIIRKKNAGLNSRQMSTAGGSFYFLFFEPLVSSLVAFPLVALLVDFSVVSKEHLPVKMIRKYKLFSRY